MCGFSRSPLMSVDFFFTILSTEFKGVQMDNSVDKCEFLWIAVGGSKVHVQLFSVDVNCQFFAKHSYYKLHNTPNLKSTRRDVLSNQLH